MQSKLCNLKPSFSDLSVEDQLQLILQRRASRRVSKRKPKDEDPNKPKKTISKRSTKGTITKSSAKSLINSLSAEDLLNLISSLESPNNEPTGAK